MDYFDYGESPDDTWAQDFDVEEFLEQSREQQRERLEQELERIEQQLEERDEIHREAIEELESKLDWYIDRLETLYLRGQGHEGERSRLKQKIEEFYRRIREEKQSRWRDCQDLERERRELQREIDETLDDSMIQEILEHPLDI